jgi:hypothetical protein
VNKEIVSVWAFDCPCDSCHVAIIPIGFRRVNTLENIFSVIGSGKPTNDINPATILTIPLIESGSIGRILTSERADEV